MEDMKKEYIFGLDIGTRTIVGTVGYLETANHFVVVAQVVREHKTRAVIDGQIHDITTVAQTIREIKEELELRVGFELSEVCIAAAGRVLKTERIKTEYEFSAETSVKEEHIRSLEMQGVEKAYEKIRVENGAAKQSFYCVGYSVVEYYLNGYSMANIELHKANRIGLEMIATFLPDEVVDGLYTAVETAGLSVANLTLEPIAAINVAIPENFRLLNIALVDVGAGTSDISIVKDGSIIAFGMMPLAGDEMTEAIARNYLIDFQTAEKIKKQATRKKQVSFKNIMGESIKISSEEVLETTKGAVDSIAKSVSEKIVELNGGKSVSAVFVVGGGGKLAGFVEKMADYLDLPQNRVAIRGAEVLKNVEFLQEGIKKDSTLVTPIGICMNYYEQKNNFIHVMVNDLQIKLYDNNRLTLLDAAVQAGFTKESLFPVRGESIRYTINGEPRTARGNMGEPAVIRKNGNNVSLNKKVEDNDQVEIVEAMRGKDGNILVSELPEAKKEIHITCQEKMMILPPNIYVNDKIVSGFYEIANNDVVVVKPEHTLEEVLEYVGEDKESIWLCNGRVKELGESIAEGDVLHKQEITKNPVEEVVEAGTVAAEPTKLELEETDKKMDNDIVFVNGELTRLESKPSHIFVDVFDVYPFDLTAGAGRRLVSKVNGVEVDFTVPIHGGDEIELIWG